MAFYGIVKVDKMSRETTTLTVAEPIDGDLTARGARQVPTLAERIVAHDGLVAGREEKAVEERRAGK